MINTVSNYSLTKTYQRKKERALEDRNRYDTDELEELDVEFPEGGGQTGTNDCKHKTQNTSPNNISTKKDYVWTNDDIISGWTD